MGTLPDEAYAALAALKNHDWVSLAIVGVISQQKRYEQYLKETQELMLACEPWTSLILDEWMKGNRNSDNADIAWLESVFNPAICKIDGASRVGA